MKTDIQPGDFGDRLTVGVLKVESLRQLEQMIEDLLIVRARWRRAEAKRNKELKVA